MPQLTDEQLARREREIRLALTAAEQRYGQAALATALDPASDEQATAAEEVKRLRDQLDAIELAQAEKSRADKQARRDAEIAAWEATRGEIDTIAEEAETFAQGLDDLRRQALAFVDRYAADYARISELLRRHKVSRREGLSYALFSFNTQREAKGQKARAALYGLATLQEMFVALGGDASAAAAELRPSQEYV